MALEEFIETHDPTKDDNVLSARAQLTEANEFLTKVASSESPVVLFDIIN